MFKKGPHIRISSLAIIITIFIILIYIPEKSEALEIGGYITRLNVNPQYMNNEDVIIQVVAFRSSADNKVIKEPISVFVYLGRESMGYVDELKLSHNQTIMGSAHKTNINLGRLDLGTWRIKVEFYFEDGAMREYEHSFLVSHIPIKYSLVFLKNGEEIFFKSYDKGRSFNIEVWLNKGKEAEQHGPTYYNVTGSKKIFIDPGDSISVTIYVTDEYNWTNAMDIDYTYYYVKSKMDIWYDLFAVFLVIAVFLIFAVMLKRAWFK